ncbi:MAG: hypothetical protein KAI53_04905 [Candidatus Aenigmarchaeota archaeon]|nr:hypothetical protein [Candidatus Aenigmarchaeota archaeon]
MDEIEPIEIRPELCALQQSIYGNVVGDVIPITPEQKRKYEQHNFVSIRLDDIYSHIRGNIWVDVKSLTELTGTNPKYIWVGDFKQDSFKINIYAENYRKEELPKGFKKLDLRRNSEAIEIITDMRNFEHQDIKYMVDELNPIYATGL